jgi:elongation factor G
VAPDPAGPLLVRVFKTSADPFVGRLTFLRVLSGTLRSQSSVFNASRGEDERVGQLLLLHGKEQEPVGELKAGEIGAVAKLSVTHTGDTISSKEQPLSLPPIPFPEPTLTVAIEPLTKADLDKMGADLQRMLEEEPSARVERSAASICAMAEACARSIGVVGWGRMRFPRRTRGMRRRRISSCRGRRGRAPAARPRRPWAPPVARPA